ncbi:MAG: dihydropteroate synthase [Bacteroidota bacterium]
MNSSLSINCRGRLLTLDRPRIMGVLNATPDSFSDGGQFQEVSAAMKQAEQMIQAGADLIDLGGYSSRPYADPVSEEEEIRRIAPIAAEILKEFPGTILSIDTFRPGVAAELLDIGAHLINDISAGSALGEPSSIGLSMIELLAKKGQVPYILMHMQGTPENMQDRPEYQAVGEEVWAFLVEKLRQCQAAQLHDVILDPGFGFGKKIAHNYQLLYQIDRFQLLNKPLLVGISRKSMMYKLLQKKPTEVQAATAALHWKCLEAGAHILRVHDVEETVQLVELFVHLRDYGII